MAHFIDFGRQRRTKRGAVMLEAVIVALFLTMTFMLLVTVAGLYKVKLEAAHEARGRNTLNATNNCTIEGTSLSQPIRLPEESQVSSLEAGVRRLIDLTRSLVHGGGMSRVRVSSRFAFGAQSQPSTGPGSGRVSWTTSMACNEEPLSPDPFYVMGQLGVRDEVESALSSMFSGF